MEGRGGKEGKSGDLKAEAVKIWLKKRWSKVNCNKADSAAARARGEDVGYSDMVKFI